MRSSSFWLSSCLFLSANMKVKEAHRLIIRDRNLFSFFFKLYLEPGVAREAAIKGKVLSVLDIYSGGIIKPASIVISVKAYANLPSLEAAGTPVSNTFGISG